MPRVLSSAEYEELGKQYYKQKEYQKALDAFTEGLDASTTPNLDLLDYRAATFAKIGNLDAALRDSRRVIQLGKQNVKGYLRTGQILQKKGNLETALGIYKYGSKNVPVTDENYSLLKGMRDKLERQLTTPTALDPLTVFPVEVAEMILGYLNFKNIVNCLRVSRSWNAFIKSRKTLWVNVDLSLSKKLVPTSFIRRCAEISRYKLQSIILHRTDVYEALKFLAKRCNDLQSIDVRSGTKFSDLPIGETLINTAAAAKNLKTIKFDRHQIIVDHIYHVLRLRPTLVHLDFRSVNCLTNGIAEWKEDYPELRILRFHCLDSDLPRRALSETLNLDELLKRAPGIEELSIEGSADLGVRSLQPLDLTVLKNLQTLEMKKFSVPMLPPLPASLRSLRISRWKLGASGSWNPQGIMVMAQRNILPKLERLEFSFLESFDVPVVPLVYKLIAEDESGGRLDAGDHCKLTTLRLQRSMPFSTERVQDSGNEVTWKALFSLPQLSELKELDVASTWAFEDKDAEALLDTNNPPLEVVNFSGTNITGIGVKRLVLGTRKTLRDLILDDCTQIGFDAIEWARQQGINVSYRSTAGKGSKSGRKVRELV